MKVKLYRTYNGPCPYLPDGEWITRSFFSNRLSDLMYEQLLENGWRRSGRSFYQNTCPGCKSCVPIRIDVEKFSPSRSQCRTLHRNSDITEERIPAVYDDNDYLLYKKYCLARHDHEPTVADYQQFLIDSPLSSHIMRYFAGTRLLAVAWIDLLPGSVSSVYCAYAPDSANRSLGTLSILRQIALCRKLEKPWLYLGFYVPDSPKMSYKENFNPHQLLINGRWQTPDSDTLR